MDRGRRVLLWTFFPTISGQISSATNMVNFTTIARYGASTDMVDYYYWIYKALNGTPTGMVESYLNLSCAW